MSWRDTQHKLNSFGYALSVDGIPGPKTYSALFAYMGARAQATTLGESAAVQFPECELVSGLRIAHWLAQFGVESRNFASFEEDLNYSATRLCQVWPHRFPTLAAAAPYANNPEALANSVYGGRMGNNEPGDGWLYRGRGPGLTGRENYAACEVRTGLPLVDQPDLAADPANFVQIACDYWEDNSCNALADDDDLRAITVLINGGLNGFSERTTLLRRAKAVLP